MGNLLRCGAHIKIEIGTWNLGGYFFYFHIYLYSIENNNVKYCDALGLRTRRDLVSSRLVSSRFYETRPRRYILNKTETRPRESRVRSRAFVVSSSFFVCFNVTNIYVKSNSIILKSSYFYYCDKLKKHSIFFKIFLIFVSLPYIRSEKSFFL